MANLTHYTSKKKPIILENGESPVWLTVNEILDKYDNYAHSIAYKNRLYILSGYSPKYEEDDLYVLAMEALFIAYNKYDVKYGVPFLAYAKSQINFKMKNVKDDINCSKREHDKKTVYVDLGSDDTEELLNIYNDFDVTYLEVSEYIHQITEGDRFEMEMKSICKCAMESGKINISEIQETTGKSKKDVSNIRAKLKKILIKENEKSGFFEDLSKMC